MYSQNVPELDKKKTIFSKHLKIVLPSISHIYKEMQNIISKYEKNINKQMHGHIYIAKTLVTFAFKIIVLQFHLWSPLRIKLYYIGYWVWSVYL